MSNKYFLNARQFLKKKYGKTIFTPMEEYFPTFESILSVDELDLESIALVRFSSLAFQMISHWVQNFSFTRHGFRVSWAISLFSCPQTSAGPRLMHPGEFYLLSFPHELTQDFCLMHILKPRGFVEMRSIVQHGEISVHLHLENYSSLLQAETDA